MDLLFNAAVTVLLALGFASVLYLAEGAVLLVLWLHDRWRWLRWFSWQ